MTNNTKFTKKDFLSSDEPYEYVRKGKDQHECKQRMCLVNENAIEIGIRNFGKLYSCYSKEKMGLPSSSE